MPKRMLIIAAFIFACQCSLATEPYKVDAATGAGDGKYASNTDHLVPTGDADWGTVESSGSYLAQFTRSSFVMGWPGVNMDKMPWSDYSGYFILFKTKDGRYILRAGPIPKKAPMQARTPKGYSDAIVPLSMAQMIYEIWTNALLQVRYNREQVMPMPHDDFFWFSAYNSDLGELEGYSNSSTSNPDSPPRWMADIGDDLVDFARDPKRDPKKMQAKLAAMRNKLFHYLRWHGIH